MSEFLKIFQNTLEIIFLVLQGCPKDYNEYVIYESRRAMIDYIITFRVNQQGQDRLRERVPSPLFDSQGRGELIIHLLQGGGGVRSVG